MRRFKLRRHSYRARTTTPASTKGQRRTVDPLYSLGDPRFCEGARRTVLGIVSGRFPNGKRAILIGSSQFNYSVFK